MKLDIVTKAKAVTFLNNMLWFTTQIAHFINEQNLKI